MALGMYKNAMNDLIKILELEPNNKQAKLDLEVVNDKIKLVSKWFKCFNWFNILQINY